MSTMSISDILEDFKQSLPSFHLDDNRDILEYSDDECDAVSEDDNYSSHCNRCKKLHPDISICSNNRISSCSHHNDDCCWKRHSYIGCSMCENNHNNCGNSTCERRGRYVDEHDSPGFWHDNNYKPLYSDDDY